MKIKKTEYSQNSVSGKVIKLSSAGDKETSQTEHDGDVIVLGRKESKDNEKTPSTIVRLSKFIKNLKDIFDFIF